MLPVSNVATLIAERRDAMIEEWVRRVRAFLVGSAHTDGELRDHVPFVLDDLVTSLERGAVVLDDPRMPGETPPARHGRERLRIGFEVEAVVAEYALLHRIIVDTLELAHVAPTLRESRVLLEFFSSAVLDSVTEHRRGAREEEQGARLRDERLMAEARAREAELRLVTDSLPVLVSFVDENARYRLVNRAYEEWFDLPRDAIEGHTVREIVGEPAYARLSECVKRALEGERFTFEGYDVPYPAKGIRDIRASFMPYVDAAGQQRGYVTLLEDITEDRRLARERDVAAAQRMEVLESMGDAFFALASDWRIVVVNREMERIAKKPRDELLGHDFWETFPDAKNPASQYYQSYHACMTTRVPTEFVDHYPSLGIWTDVRVSPTGAGGIAVFFRDVSREKRAEDALRRQAEFEQQLIGIVSHDLRNPLNVITLASTVLARNEDLGEGAIKTVVRIQNAAGRASRMIRDLLDFTQSRLGGGIGIQPRRTDLHAIVGTVLDEIETAYPDRTVASRNAGDGTGEWDAERLGQVVQNLVTNALKYSPPGTPVEVVTHGEGAMATLTVHNTGAPIPALLLPKIFEPFQRAGHVDNASRNVGLGLYIVREIVAAHRGTVTVTSNEEEGTTFVVTLPRA